MLLSLSQRKQITRAIETEEENPGKRMPPTGGQVERNSFSEPPDDHRSRKKTFCLIFSAATSRLTPAYSAQTPTGAESNSCLSSGHTLSAQGTGDNYSPCAPNHTLSHTHRSAPRKGMCWHSEPPGSYHCTVKPITCFFDRTHTSGWVSPLKAFTGVWSVSSEVSQQVLK